MVFSGGKKLFSDNRHTKSQSRSLTTTPTHTPKDPNANLDAGPVRRQGSAPSGQRPAIPPKPAHLRNPASPSFSPFQPSAVARSRSTPGAAGANGNVHGWGSHPGSLRNNPDENRPPGKGVPRSRDGISGAAGLATDRPWYADIDNQAANKHPVRNNEVSSKNPAQDFKIPMGDPALSALSHIPLPANGSSMAKSLYSSGYGSIEGSQVMSGSQVMAKSIDLKSNMEDIQRLASMQEQGFLFFFFWGGGGVIVCYALRLKDTFCFIFLFMHS